MKPSRAPNTNSYLSLPPRCSAAHNICTDFTDVLPAAYNLLIFSLKQTSLQGVEYRNTSNKMSKAGRFEAPISANASLGQGFILKGAYKISQAQEWQIKCSFLQNRPLSLRLTNIRGAASSYPAKQIVLPHTQLSLENTAVPSIPSSPRPPLPTSFIATAGHCTLPQATVPRPQATAFATRLQLSLQQQ
eukprot:1155363-Pelagomonas_calceolata.AAC.4